MSILCISSFFKGNRFLQTCKELGCKTYLLTVEKKLHDPWAREYLDDIWALPDFENRDALARSVAWLFREHDFDRLAPLDDFDVERVAWLREYFRIPGMGETTARYFRDKLAMRSRARDRGIPIPRFAAMTNHARISRFLESVPPPWLIKPRSEASAIGIRKVASAEEAWKVVEELGDEQSRYLIEEMLPGSIYHVDSIVWEREVVFAEASRYWTPPFEIMHGGGVFATTTMDRTDALTRSLLEHNRKVARELGFVRGVLHTEFLKKPDDETFYFIETAARVGGANIAELVEAATGVSLWAEWAKIEIAQDELPYQPPVPERNYAALVVSLAKDERPDTSSFDDPEIWFRLDKKNHVGFVLKSTSRERVETLLEDYVRRIHEQHQMSLPPPASANE